MTNDQAPMPQPAPGNFRHSCLGIRASFVIRASSLDIAMRILFVGDIVGTPGVAFLRKALPALVAREGIDLVIADAENAVAGSGLTPSVYRKLRDAGVDVVTLGDHVYKKQEIIPTLQKDDRVCRPANFPADAPGREYVLAAARDGTPVAAFCVLGR